MSETAMIVLLFFAIKTLGQVKKDEGIELKKHVGKAGDCKNQSGRFKSIPTRLLRAVFERNSFQNDKISMNSDTIIERLKQKPR